MDYQESALDTARLLYERKASDIVVLNVSHLTVLCDYMVIATARTAAQVSSLTDAVDELMAKKGLQLRRSEGMNGLITDWTACGTMEPICWRCRSTSRFRTEFRFGS